MTPQLEEAYLEGLEAALQAGYAVLEEGGFAVNAVKAALVILEDNVLFNAGRGSVFTKKGVQEMDAAIMDGANLAAGAVAGVRNVRNPIELATEVMRNSNHVFLSGKGANDFAIKARCKTGSQMNTFFRSSGTTNGKQYATQTIIRLIIPTRSWKS